MGCNCCEEPLTSINLGIEGHSGTSTGDSTEAAAWAAAVAAVPAYTGDYALFVPDPLGVYGTLNQTNRTSPGPSAYISTAGRMKYKWVFLTATCYFRIWWDEITYEETGTIGGSGTPSVTNTTPFDWTWTAPSTDGLCLPVGFDSTDTDTFPQSSIYEITEIEPTTPASAGLFYRVTVLIKNIRYTWVSGYTPTDLSDSGFPTP